MSSAQPVNEQDGRHTIEEPAAAETQKKWFTDAWRPSDVETDYTASRVEGEIPRELHGTLYRNGPSQKLLPEHGYDALHLFDGDALVHAFRFDDGAMTYRGRFVRNVSFELEQSAGRFSLNSVGCAVDDPVDSTVIREQPNTNVVFHHGKLMAMVENAYPFEIDRDTLDPVGPNDFGGKMIGMSTSAHPKIDGRTGQMVIHGYGYMEPYVQCYVVEPDGSCSLAVPVDTPWPSMMHDVAITENYIVFLLTPTVIDAGRLMSMTVPFADCLSWQPELGLKFGVMPRKGGDVRWFDAPSADFIFHPGNAYEDGNRIVMDACSYADGGGFLESLRSWRSGEINVASAYVRPVLYELDLADGDCRETVLDDRVAEFPRLDDRLVGYRNRYGYALRQEEGGIFPFSSASVVRYDREGGPSTAWTPGSGCFPSEPVFVPRAPDAAEDDGFVLSVVYDAPEDSSYVSVLDARNLSDGPLAKVYLEHRIPLGFHGNFVGGIV